VAEFVGGVDFETVFAGSVCHAGNHGNHCGMSSGGEYLDDSGVEAGTDDRVVDEDLTWCGLPVCC
jgi:hypothetical protein